MRFEMRSTLTVGLCLFVFALSGCGKKAEQTPTPTPEAEVAALRVTSIDLGKQVDPDKKVVAPAATFAPKDTVWLSVATEGAAPSATIAVTWTYGDSNEVVNSTSQPIAPTGPANSEFHISSAKGLPEGKYKVAVQLDGAPAGSKEFDIKK